MKTWEQSVLAYDPFAADRGSSARRLSDRIVMTRKAHQCCICFQITVSGEKARAITEVMDGKASTFHCCRPCCDAMVQSWMDAGNAIETRTAMGMEQAE